MVTTTNEVNRSLLEVIGQSKKPLTMNQILKKVRQGSRESVKKHVEDLVEAGKVYECVGRNGSRVCYWAHDERAIAQEKVVEALRESPLTLPQLVEQIGRKLGTGVPRTWREKIVRELSEQNDIYPLPPVGRYRSLRFSHRPPDATPYLQKCYKELDSAIKKLSRSGVDTQEILTKIYAKYQRVEHSAEGLSTIDALYNKVVEALDSDPQYLSGAEISLGKLRDAVGCDSAPAFSEVIFKLYESGKIYLHMHDNPHALAAEERGHLVTDSEERYYVGASKRS